jgi:hypothetical protein
MLITASAIRWRGRTAFFVVPLALVGGALALLSFAQRTLDATTILGVYEVQHLPGSGFFGTFVNGNHAASLFMLSAIVALAAARETEGPIKLAMILSGVVACLGVVSTGSRMGLVATALGFGALGTCWLLARFGRSRGWLLSGAMAVVGTPLVVLLALSLRTRADGTVLAGALTGVKLAGWRDGLQMAVDFPWTGVGRGAFEGPAAAYRDTAENVRLVFPENLVVQIVSEWGVPLALALIAMFVVACVPVIRQLPRWEPSFQGAACGVLAVLVHELADFGLELPGVAFPTAMALGLCAGRLQMSTSHKAGEPQKPVSKHLVVAAGVAWLVVLAAGPWAVAHSFQAEVAQARVLSGRPGPAAAAALTAMVARHPAEHMFEIYAARQAILGNQPASLRHVNRALRLFPASPTPHVMAFHQLSRAGRPAQAAMEYRMAVERGYSFDYKELVSRVGVANLPRAVPQRSEDLLQLAAALVSGGHPGEADPVTARAVELALGSRDEENMRIRRAEVAIASGQADFVRKAAAELAASASSPRAIEVAAQALAKAGDLPRAHAMLRRAITQNAGDGGLLVRSARLLLSSDDLDNARMLLVEQSTGSLPMDDRIAVEELLAEISDKQGNREAAAAARARARMLGRMREHGTRR